MVTSKFGVRGYQNDIVTEAYLACKQEGKTVCLLLTRCSSQGPCRYMSGCQYYGPFLDPYYNTAPII